MSHPDQTRRDFLKATAAATAGAAITGCASTPKAEPIDVSKIKNYNPKMGYRRLGKTDLMISEISLGGHGVIRNVSPEEQVANRRSVLDRAVELGINYVDNNMVSECELYGKAIAGNRDKFYIGFASWPTKLTTEYEKDLSKERFHREIDAQLKRYHTDMLDMWRPVGATWGSGQTKIATMYDISPHVLDMVAEVFEEVKQQGKVRHLGVSAHNPKVFRRVLNDYPQFSVVIFPYLFLSKQFGGDSLLQLAAEKDVGVVGLKPFGAGTTFGGKPKEISGKIDTRAHALLKKMLQEKRLSAIIPGVNTREQLEENVKGSYERDKPLDAKDEQALRECAENYYANITPEYHWLRHWETV